MERKVINVDELPFENRQLYELMIRIMGRENRAGFARELMISEQRISRLFFKDYRTDPRGRYPRVSDEIKSIAISRFRLPLDYFIPEFKPEYFENIEYKTHTENTGYKTHIEGKTMSFDKIDPAMLKKLNQMTEVVNVPMVTAYAYAGYLRGFGDTEYLDTLPTVPFLPDRKMTGTYVAFEVRGDSMDDGTSDAYRDGDVLICRLVEPDYYKSDRLHINKRDFVIVHEEGILIKRITEHDVENHTIRIHSLNQMYRDEVLDLADVKQIFSVVSSQRSRLR